MMMDDDFKLFRNPETLFHHSHKIRSPCCCHEWISIRGIRENDKIRANIYYRRDGFVGKTDLKLRYLISGKFYSLSVWQIQNMFRSSKEHTKLMNDGESTSACFRNMWMKRTEQTKRTFHVEMWFIWRYLISSAFVTKSKICPENVIPIVYSVCHCRKCSSCSGMKRKKVSTRNEMISPSTNKLRMKLKLDGKTFQFSNIKLLFIRWE